MSKPRILVTRRWPATVEAVLAERFDVTFNPDDIPLGENELRLALSTYDAVLPTVSDRLPAAVFDGLSVVTKILGNFGVGYNHIDISAAKDRGIAVTNTPGVLTDCTADIAMLLLLSVARRGSEGERQVRAGEWKGWCPTHMVGTKVTGKTVGIIGFGRIGKAFAQRCHFGFGMDVVFFNRSTDRSGGGGALRRAATANHRGRAGGGRFRLAALPRWSREPTPDKCGTAYGDEAGRLSHQYGAWRRGG